ncbi:MAG: ABC transporter ATP-binding protein [Candidatus Binataceae bacterium]
MPIGKTVVAASGLRKSYGSRLVVDGVSLKVKAGEVIGLLGPNGAGKTTTLSILATLLAPDAGDISIAGITPRDPRALRRKLGFVPQAIALYPALSALRNLQFFARIHGLGKRDARDESMRVLEEVGLTQRAHDAVAVLSGGMQRRLNLACGMVHRPEVLLLDEPTVGVDPQSRERILLTVRCAAEAGAAVIYSTHYMDEVERLCDGVLLIDRGRLMANGTVAEIIVLGGRQPRMEITFQRRPSPGWCDGLRGVNELAPADGDGKAALELASLAQVSELLEQARARGGQVLEFSVHSPNLSDAFIALTGHALREPGPEAR